MDGREDYRIWNSQLISYACYDDKEDETTGGGGDAPQNMANGDGARHRSSLIPSGDGKSEATTTSPVPSTCPVLKGDPANYEITKVGSRIFEI